MDWWEPWMTHTAYFFGGYLVGWITWLVALGLCRAAGEPPPPDPGITTLDSSYPRDRRLN